MDRRRAWALQKRCSRKQRVLTEAAINGKVDYLRGLKENVIMAAWFPPAPGWSSVFFGNLKP
jgi:hypothetical protein